MTTRAPIFEEARRISEHLADKRLDITKYVLDVCVYTRRIKARILYNHLLVSGISLDHIKALWSAGAVPKIVDHKNYSPRIIETMTDGIQAREIKPEDYPSEFIKALNNPLRIWDVSFRKHIPQKCRHLLFALFFCSDYGASIDELRTAFDGLHQFLSSKYAAQSDPKDFEEALRILESGYVNIRDKGVTFINPSLRDYLTDYLDDEELICDLAACAQKADWAERIWKHVRVEKLWSQNKQKRVAESFLKIAERFSALPEMKKSETNQNSWNFYDLCFAERINLALVWFACSGEKRFAEIALSLAEDRIGKFSAWHDAARLVRLIASLQSDEFGDIPNAPKLRDTAEQGLVAILDGHVWPDDLENICDAIDLNKDDLSSKITEMANRAMLSQIEDVDSLIEDIDSESTLTDHIKAMRRFAPRLGVPDSVLEQAVAKVEERISEINESVETADSPDFFGSSFSETEKFDDVALKDLFTPLLEGLK